MKKKKLEKKYFVNLIFASEMQEDKTAKPPTTHALEVAGESLILHPEKVIYWPRLEALLIADLHLGKVSHFRKAGIGVPTELVQKNFDRLAQVIAEFEPKVLILLGDLFHSSTNSEWDAFGEFLKQYPDLDVELVVGNHDILATDLYFKYHIQLHYDVLQVPPFIFSHEPLDLKAYEGDLYNLCGHIHPGVRLRGAGRQSLRLACFYFGEAQGILPAFGEFTGKFVIAPKKKDQVVAIAEGELVPV